jgi:hypothetical protein
MTSFFEVKLLKCHFEEKINLKTTPKTTSFWKKKKKKEEKEEEGW